MTRVAGGQDYARVKDPTNAGEQALLDVDQVFGALAHPTRRHILLVLRFRGGEMTAGEVAGRFDCAWPTISRHLKVLQEAGLVIQSKRGRERIYTLDPQRLHRVTGNWLRWFEGPRPKTP